MPSRREDCGLTRGQSSEWHKVGAGGWTYAKLIMSDLCCSCGRPKPPRWRGYCTLHAENTHQQNPQSGPVLICSPARYAARCVAATGSRNRLAFRFTQLKPADYLRGRIEKTAQQRFRRRFPARGQLPEPRQGKEWVASSPEFTRRRWGSSR